MKLKSRMLAMILAVLAIVGCIPMMIFAEGDSSAVQELPKVEKLPTADSTANKDLAALKAALGATADTDITLYTDFNKLGEVGGSISEKSIIGSVSGEGGIGASSCTLFKSSNGDSWKIGDDGKGGQAAQMWGSAGTSDYYMELYFHDQKTDPNGKYHTGESFNVQLDFKLGPTDPIFAHTGFIQMISRGYGTNTVFIPVVGMDANGGLYMCNDSKKEVLGYANATEYTTIGLHFDVPNNKVYLYLNGVLANPGGDVFMSNANIALFKDNNGNGTAAELSDCIINEARLYQISSSIQQIKGGYASFDNIMMYYSDSYVGEVKDAKAETGYIEKDGKVYYVKDGFIMPNFTTPEGYATNVFGQVCTTTKTKIIANNKFAEAVPGISDKVLGYEFYGIENIKMGTTYTFNLAVTDLTSFDALEFDFYGEAPTLLAMFSFSNGNNYNGDNTGESYWSNYLNLTDSDITAYKADGTSFTMSKRFGAPHDVGEGFQAFVLPLSSFGKNRASTWNNLKQFKLITSWSEMGNFKFEADKTTLAYTKGNDSIYFTGIYGIKNTPVASLSELKAPSIIDGVEIPATGYGWQTYGGIKVFYDLYTGDLVKNTAVSDPADGKVYSIDANGKATIANGFVKAGRNTYYVTDGVVATSDVTVDGKTYSIGSKGYVNTPNAYKLPAAYTATNYAEDVTYIFKADFNNQTVGALAPNKNPANISAGASTGWAIAGKGGQAAYVQRAEGDVAVTVYNTSTCNDPYLNINLTADQKKAVKGQKVVFDLDVMIDKNWDAEMNILQVIQRDDAGAGYSGGPIFGGLLHINPEGNLRTTQGSIQIAMLPKGEYTKISVALDTATKKMDVYVNGVLLLEKADIQNGNNANLTGFSEIRTAQHSSNTTTPYVKGHGTIAIDNFYIYLADAPQNVVKDVTLTNGAVEENGVVQFYNNGKPDTSKKNGDVIIAENGAVYMVTNATLGAGVVCPVVDGKVEINGVPANGDIGGKFWNDGVLANGEIGGTTYFNGVVADGEIEGVLYEAGKKANGFRGGDGTLETATYYKDGVPSAYEHSAMVDGVPYIYKYGDDGKFVEKYTTEMKFVTFIIVKDGSEIYKEVVAFTANSAYTNTIAEIAGYTLTITSKAGDADAINGNKITMNVTQDDTFVIEYVAE